MSTPSLPFHVMKESQSLTIYIASKILVKRRVKVILVLLFCFSLLFLSYQFVNYSTLTSYQSQEYKKLVGGKSGGFGFAARHRGSAGGGYHSLKDIALKFETGKQSHNHLEGQASISPSKGDTGPLSAPDLRHRKGKPIFAEHVLGVAPEAQKHYLRHNQKNKNFFSCLTSGKQITWDKVNDDFCDCPSDGSDEPSTAACMNGRFFCSTVKQGFPEYVPSSFVNDG